MKKLILFGAGDYGKGWLKKVGSEKVFAFADFDENKIGNYLCGKKILSVEELVKIKDDIDIFISTSSKYAKQIKYKLSFYSLLTCIIDNVEINNASYISKDSNVKDTVFEGNNCIWSKSNIYGSYIGYGTYIGEKAYVACTKFGKYTSIGPGLYIISGQHPSTKFVSTYPAFYSKDNMSTMFSYVEENIYDEHRFAELPFYVSIGNDVWIGANVSIMEGVKVADGTIIGANSNVIHDTKPYSIVVGNPAKCIKFRFEQKEIVFLQNLEWWNKPKKWIEEHAKYFRDIKELINKCSV